MFRLGGTEWQERPGWFLDVKRLRAILRGILVYYILYMKYIKLPKVYQATQMLHFTREYLDTYRHFPLTGSPFFHLYNVGK